MGGRESKSKYAILGYLTIEPMSGSGWEELRRWLARPVESHQRDSSELLLKLFFGGHAAP